MKYIINYMDSVSVDADNEDEAIKMTEQLYGIYNAESVKLNTYMMEIELNCYRDNKYTLPYTTKLDLISYLQHKGSNTALSEEEINILDKLYEEMFGGHLDENQKKLYR